MREKQPPKRASSGVQKPEIRAQSPSDESDIMSPSPTPDSESSCRDDEVISHLTFDRDKMNDDKMKRLI